MPPLPHRLEFNMQIVLCVCTVMFNLKHEGASAGLCGYWRLLTILGAAASQLCSPCQHQCGP